MGWVNLIRFVEVGFLDLRVGQGSLCHVCWNRFDGSLCWIGFAGSDLFGRVNWAGHTGLGSLGWVCLVRFASLNMLGQVCWDMFVSPVLLCSVIWGRIAELGLPGQDCLVWICWLGGLVYWVL